MGLYFFIGEMTVFFSLAFPESHSHLKLILEQQVSTENIYLFLVGNLSVLGKIDASLKSRYIMLSFSHVSHSSSKLRSTVRSVGKAFWSYVFTYFRCHLVSCSCSKRGIPTRITGMEKP